MSPWAMPPRKVLRYDVAQAEVIGDCLPSTLMWRGHLCLQRPALLRDVRPEAAAPHFRHRPRRRLRQPDRATGTVLYFLDMGSTDFITLFGTPETDRYSQAERLAFLQGYHDASLNMQDPNRPLSILQERREAPLGLEQAYQDGQMKAESDLEEKKALDATTIAAIIAAL